MESTYGGSDDVQPSRAEAEEKLYETIDTTIKRGGKGHHPRSPSGGRQEVMLALEEGSAQTGKIPEQ